MYFLRHGRVHFAAGERARVVVAVDADHESFETLSLSWAKDQSHVFYRGKVVSGLAPASLRSSYGLIKTELDIYLDEHPMDLDPSVDVASFRPLGGPFYRDDSSIYCVWYSYDALSCDLLDVDVDTFEHVAECFGRDARGLLSHVRREEEVDAPTFAVFHERFARDDNHVYAIYRGDKHSDWTTLGIVEGADPETFEVFHPHYARDAQAVYFFDDCGGLAAARFLLTECVRVETDRAENFVPLQSHETGDVVPDGFDGTSLFLRGRRLNLPKDTYSVCVRNSETCLEYVDLDRVCAIVAPRYSEFFPTERAPECVDPKTLGPVGVDGAPGATGVAERKSVLVNEPGEDDIPF